MQYNMIRPCKHCPFRSDRPGYLHGERAREIAWAISAGQMTFSCHETTEHTDDDEVIETADTEHCAGAMILLEHIGRPNQMMRIAERIGMYDRRKLDMNAPVHRNLRTFILAHAKKNRRGVPEFEPLEDV